MNDKELDKIVYDLVEEFITGYEDAKTLTQNIKYNYTFDSVLVFKKNIQSLLKQAELRGRIDEVKNQVNVYSYYPTDPGGISNRKLRLKHLEAELTKLKGDKT